MLQPALPQYLRHFIGPADQRQLYVVQPRNRVDQMADALSIPSVCKRPR